MLQRVVDEIINGLLNQTFGFSDDVFVSTTFACVMIFCR
jgi:hypothetical protein